jgi:hypothetical protein
LEFSKKGQTENSFVKKNVGRQNLLFFQQMPRLAFKRKKRRALFYVTPAAG